MNDKIRSRCTECGKVLSVSSKAIGKTVSCPSCGKRTKIRPPRDSKTIDVRMAGQPSFTDEISNDHRRAVSAVSFEKDKFDIIQPYLMDYEQPISMAVQRQFPFSLFSDIVLLSSHRLMVFKRFFTKVDMFDVNYVDIGNVTVRQGYFTSSLRIITSFKKECVANRLVTSQALAIYRHCQDIETKARMARRQFQLEDNRSRTNQTQVNNIIAPGTTSPPALPPPQNQIGDEEFNPFKIGD